MGVNPPPPPQKFLAIQLGVLGEVRGYTDWLRHTIRTFLGLCFPELWGREHEISRVEIGRGASRPPYSGVFDPKTLEYRRIGPGLTATFLLSPHQWQKFFLNRVSTPPPIIGVDGGIVNFDVLLYAKSFALSFDPYFVEKSRDISIPISKKLKKAL